MTREEKLIKLYKAADNYVSTIRMIESLVCLNMSDLRDAFIKGAHWSDKNQFSPWIDVKKDLPCNHKELLSETPKLIHSKEVLTTKNILVVLTYDAVTLVSMIYNEINNKWEWDSIFKDEIVFWSPIPELPKT